MIIYMRKIVAFLLIFGALIVIQHNVWVGPERRILVTVIGWLMLIKGLLYLFIPNLLAVIPMRRLRPWATLFGVLAVAVGIYLFQIS